MHLRKEYIITRDKLLDSKVKITENGGTIYPDGSFKVKGVEGNFWTEGDQLIVIVRNKP